MSRFFYVSASPVIVLVETTSLRELMCVDKDQRGESEVKVQGT